VNEGEAAPSIEPLARTTRPVSIIIGGRPAAVFFAGLAPGFAGLYQINLTVPPSVEPGDEIPVTLQVAGQTNSSATIALR
jgi:uncharacterized protein (TIGR03437 family)